MSEKKNTYDNQQVNRPLVVLRHVDLARMDRRTVRLIGASAIGYKQQEAQLVWFQDGFILNDQPRLDGVVKEIMAATIDFAVGRPDTQSILMEKLSLKAAERAVGGAKLTLAVDVELPEEEKKPGRQPRKSAKAAEPQVEVAADSDADGE